MLLSTSIHFYLLANNQCSVPQVPVLYVSHLDSLVSCSSWYLTLITSSYFLHFDSGAPSCTSWLSATQVYFYRSAFILLSFAPPPATHMI